MKSLQKLRYVKYGDFSIIPTIDGRVAVLNNDNIIVKICYLPEGWAEWRLGSLHGYIKDQLAESGGVIP